MLNNLIEEFRDVIDIKDYFSYLYFEIVKEEILSSKSNIIFILGDPGSGKSFLFNYLKSKYPNDFILLKEPFFSKEEFLERINLKEDEIVNKKILVDEAQLIPENVMEFLRILSDKGNQIIFGMHKKEGEAIVKLPQFASRYTQKVYMNTLNLGEFENYVVKKFAKHSKFDLIEKKILKKVYKFTKGNFRLSKKFIFTSLRLLDFSLKNNLKYKKIDNCIVEMSAIELGLLK